MTQSNMERYSVIDTKMPREFILLQGTGCRWKKCTFCDYHTDTCENPFEANRKVLARVTGVHGVLDIINSGSCIEIDEQTCNMIAEMAMAKGIHTLWFEAHYMYRNHLSAFAERFKPLNVKFRCGVETFDAETRNKWNKGFPDGATPSDIANHFSGICLLCCVEGQTREQIVNDIAIAKRHFEYFSVNVFCNNTTSVRRSEDLYTWFCTEIYPKIKDDPQMEILIENTDLGVGATD